MPGAVLCWKERRAFVAIVRRRAADGGRMKAGGGALATRARQRQDESKADGADVAAGCELTASASRRLNLRVRSRPTRTLWSTNPG